MEEKDSMDQIMISVYENEPEARSPESLNQG